MRLMLTGIAQETHFSPPSTLLYLVFNNGDLKVPVTEEQAALVLEQVGPMMEDPEDDAEKEKQSYEYEAVPHLSAVPEHDVTETEEEEDGVGQI